MRLALVADIHGNWPALEAVLNAAPQVDAWLCMGDLVGYYPDVNEVCQAVFSLDPNIVRGNHDAYVTGDLSPNPEKRALYRIDWTRAHLQSEHLERIASLPIQLNLAFGDRSFIVRHASPWDEETYLYPDSHRLSEIRLKSNTYLVLGHTHYPMVAAAGEGFVVNPGSVGQPRDYNPEASYATVDVETGVVELRRAPYDVVSYQDHLSKLGWPESTISILSRSRLSPLK
jgi:putative phosphoesterase